MKMTKKRKSMTDDNKRAIKVSTEGSIHKMHHVANNVSVGQSTLKKCVWFMEPL